MRPSWLTNGPHARVGQVLEIPFERPRARAEVLEHSEYYNLRGSLVQFLEEQEHARHPTPLKAAHTQSMIDTAVDMRVYGVADFSAIDKICAET